MVEVSSCPDAQYTNFPTEVFGKSSYSICGTRFAQIVQEIFDSESKSLNTTLTYPQIVQINFALSRKI